MNTGINKQGGFSAVMALVLIVLFALLGAYMATLSSVSALSTATSASAIQAWFAARSGVEWAVHESLDLGTCTGVNGQTISFSSGGLNGFQAAVGCAETTGVTEGPDTYNIYNIGVTATRGTAGQPAFASRTIRVTVTDRTAP
ncbi:MAG: hypothetical protein HW411_212 [Gammaproteobacteria bacterium]|nr:hypothetical protein [Gammaproteobacteria bacterium]